MPIVLTLGKFTALRLAMSKLLRVREVGSLDISDRVLKATILANSIIDGGATIPAASFAPLRCSLDSAAGRNSL